MKILHVTIGLPPTISGGLPIYVDSLAGEEQNQGHEVYILQPGNIKIHGNVKIKKIKHSKFNVFSIINPLPVSSIFGIVGPSDYKKQCDKQIYINFLKKMNFDIIHIHSIMGIHKEFFEAVHELNIKMIMTTHDYFGLCLKTNFIDKNSKLCDGPESVKCSNCNYNCGLSKNKAMLIQSNIYKKMKNSYLVTKLRKKIRNDVTTSNDNSNEITFEVVNQYNELIKYYKEIFKFIDFFHFNSDVSKTIYEDNLGKINGKVIPITTSDIQDKRRIKKFDHNIRIGYIGRVEEYKGINVLINALEKMDKEQIDFECYLYGDNFSKFDSYLNKIHNCGRYSRNELESIFDKLDILVAPSIWYETFGFITLEALAHGVPVIVTDRVGSKLLLKKYNGECIIRPDVDELKKTLILYSNNKEKLTKYNKWIVEKFKFINNHEHTREILKLYEKVK